jgi:calcineurin-like phosphoesterase family protein
MTVWFTSDPHWGHAFVSGIRGFSDPAEHDASLLANYQRLIRPEDQVWWLGDLAMNKPDHALAIIDSIPGTHHLVTGNHDRCSPIFRDAHKWQRAYLDVFASVQAFARRRIVSSEVLLSHFPYADGTSDADHTEYPRYSQYRLPDEGRWLIHGHTHNAAQKLHGRQVHVGVDAWNFEPVSLATIEHYVRTAPNA